MFTTESKLARLSNDAVRLVRSGVQIIVDAVVHVMVHIIVTPGYCQCLLESTRRAGPYHLVLYSRWNL